MTDRSTEALADLLSKVGGSKEDQHVRERDRQRACLAAASGKPAATAPALRVEGVEPGPRRKVGTLSPERAALFAKAADGAKRRVTEEKAARVAMASAPRSEPSRPSKEPADADRDPTAPVLLDVPPIGGADAEPGRRADLAAKVAEATACLDAGRKPPARPARLQSEPSAVAAEIEAKPDRSAASAIEKAMIAAYEDEGLSLNAVARACDATPPVVRDVLVRFGVEIQKPGNPRAGAAKAEPSALPQKAPPAPSTTHPVENHGTDGERPSERTRNADGSPSEEARIGTVIGQLAASGPAGIAAADLCIRACPSPEHLAAMLEAAREEVRP